MDWMIDLDEAELYEWKGLIGAQEFGQPMTYTFRNIMRTQSGVSWFDYWDVFPVSWVDWNDNGVNDVFTDDGKVMIIEQRDLAARNDAEDPVKCQQREIGGQTYWVNLVTGQRSPGNDDSACYDVLKGGDYPLCLGGVAASEADYLRNADMSEWAFDDAQMWTLGPTSMTAGAWQYTMAMGEPRFVPAVLTHPGPRYTHVVIDEVD
jgi:hypothetical protein